MVLGGALSNPAQLARGVGICKGRQRRRLAGEALQNLLGQDFAAERCWTTASLGGAEPD